METTGENTSSACFVCKNPGAAWYCQRKGCNRRYHVHCVKKHQPDDFITIGGWWHCVNCVKEKLQFGVVFECDEVESIWDVINGESETKYMVKYKNLAHVHNCWIPKSKICQEASELVANFDQAYQKDKGTTWKDEWTQVERLLMKRKLLYANMAQKFFQGLGNQFQYCNTEWLVKWRGLGYEHVTWELGTLKFLDSAEAKRLKKEYNSRQVDAARRAKLASEPNKIKQDPFVNLETFPSGFPHGLDDGYLDSLNRLRQFWHKSKNAVLINQEERVIRTILFIKSISDHIAQPFLILTMVESLPLWEDKIRQLAPSVNTVVHTNRSASSLVEVTEFWGRDGHLLFQVLLSSPDAIQGFEAIKHINWEGVIVDQCDDVNMSTHLERFKALSANFKLLVLNTRLKDDPSQYMNLMSFLEPGDMDPIPDISILKERFSRFIVYQTETDSSNCDRVPLAGEKEGDVSEVLDNRDCAQCLFPVGNPRKRKASLNDFQNLFVPNDFRMLKRRAFLKKPRNTSILKSSYKKVGLTLSMQLANLSLSSIQADDPASRDFSVAEIRNQIMDAEGSNHRAVSNDGIRTINFLVKPRLSRMCEMLGIPENVIAVANIFSDHIMKSHKAMLAPFIIPRSYLEGPLTVASRYRSSSQNEPCEHFLHWLEILKRIFSPHFVPRLGYYDPPSTVSTNAHQAHVVLQETNSLKHKIERLCARRKNELCTLQKNQLLDLERHGKREGLCHWMAHGTVVKHMHTIATSDKVSNNLLKKTVLKFKAFQEHVACERRRLESLQEKARALEELRKEEWAKMAMSGELESFDFSWIPLPGSGFVFKKFDWDCGERSINYGASSSGENALNKLDHGQPTVGNLSSVLAGASFTNMGEPPDVVQVQQYDEPVARPSNMTSINTSSAKGSNLTMQQANEASSPKYAGSSAVSHEVEISQQLSTDATFFQAEGTTVDLEELPDFYDMLIEPAERENDTSTCASMPDIGVSTLEADVLSESSNFLEMPSFTQEMFPNGLNPDPLLNEFTRINHRRLNLLKKHEEKKSRIRLQCEWEIASVKRKYDKLNEEEDTTLMKHRKVLRDQEMRAFIMTSQSPGPLQGWTQSPPPDISAPSDCLFRSSFMNCASFGLSSCSPPLQNTQAPPVDTIQTPPLATNQAPPLANQVLYVQTNLGMRPLTSWAPPVQRTRAPIPRNCTVPFSPFLEPHARADSASRLRASLSRPTLTHQVPPLITNMSCSLSSIGPQTISSLIQSPHLLNNGFPSAHNIAVPPISTNRARPVQTAALSASLLGSQHAFSSQYAQHPAHNLFHHWPQMLISRPVAHQASPSGCSCNAHNFGGSHSDPAWRSG